MNEELKKLFEGMELSEDFKRKFEEVFAARIAEDTKQIKEQAEADADEKYSALAEDYSQYVVTENEEKMDNYLAEEVSPTVERYLDYVAQEFVTENKMVIESETKVELADQFLSGFSQIAEQYNVTVPVGQDDVVAKLKAQVTEANATVDRLLTRTEELKEQIQANTKEDIIESVGADMTDTTKERFVKGCAKIKFHDQDQFTSAVKELKESYSPVSDDKQLDEKSKEPVQELVVEKDTWMDNLLSRV
jgi:hypothetical protein